MYEYAKTAWVFLLDEKNHAKVYGFFEPERLKPC
jgi:rRNA processing protein Krr1/Pno1